MKKYSVKIQGDRYPTYEEVEADSFVEALKKIIETADWGKLKLTRLTNKLSIVLEKSQS